eukprot:1836825-Prymnesium_polylepis.1
MTIDELFRHITTHRRMVADVTSGKSINILMDIASCPRLHVVRFQDLILVLKIALRLCRYDILYVEVQCGIVASMARPEPTVRIDNWGFDMDTLEAQCRAALSRSKAEGGQDMPIPELQSILGNSSIAGLITGYLGASVRYDGHVIKNTPSVWTRAKMRTFPAGKWHHDRCGRRLKMFIYLSNVTSRSHPTTIAAGTHNTMYYSHSSQFFDLSRYSDEHVRKHHRVEAMHGLRGGGFIFDTNALHKIEMIGSDPRLLLALEFHPHGKVPALRRFPDNPCPSRRKLFESLFKNNTRWAHGEFDFPLYPPER